MGQFDSRNSAKHDEERDGCGAAPLKCSFCEKSQKHCKKLIAGPGVYICDECIDLCNETIEEELPSWPWHRTAPQGID